MRSDLTSLQSALARMVSRYGDATVEAVRSPDRQARVRAWRAVRRRYAAICRLAAALGRQGCGLDRQDRVDLFTGRVDRLTHEAERAQPTPGTATRSASARPWS